MKFLQIFKSKKIFFLYIFFTLYIRKKLKGGERGIISKKKKKNVQKNLFEKKKIIENKLVLIENKNNLLSKKIDLDYLDILYREKLKFGKKEEIIIKLK